MTRSPLSFFFLSTTHTARCGSTFTAAATTNTTTVYSVFPRFQRIYVQPCKLYLLQSRNSLNVADIDAGNAAN